MPRYDYRCTACDTVFEIEHGMRERPHVTCPDCGSPAERVLNASGIVLKGSGFYNTDQRGKKGGTEATGATAPSESTELAKTGEKAIKKADDGGSKEIAKPADKPAKPAAAPAPSAAKGA